MRYTVTDVREMYERFVEAATEAGFDTARWCLEEGNAVNGRPYSLYARSERGGGSGLHKTPFAGGGWGGGTLGGTARQAYETLYAYCRALAAVRDLHRP